MQPPICIAEPVEQFRLPGASTLAFRLLKIENRDRFVKSYSIKYEWITLILSYIRVDGTIRSDLTIAGNNGAARTDSPTAVLQGASGHCCPSPRHMEGHLALPQTRLLQLLACTAISCSSSSICGCFALAWPLLSPRPQQDNAPKRGRKYKAPPPTARIEVTVLRDINGKPIENAAVVFHPMEGEKDKGDMELKTNEDGKTIIDVMPIGDTVRLQIIAKGFQTYGEDYKIDKPEMAIEIRMKRPGEQYSIYKKPRRNVRSPARVPTATSRRKLPRMQRQRRSRTTPPSSRMLSPASPPRSSKANHGPPSSRSRSGTEHSGLDRNEPNHAKPTSQRQIGTGHRGARRIGRGDRAGSGPGRGGCGHHLPDFATRGCCRRPARSSPGMPRSC